MLKVKIGGVVILAMIFIAIFAPLLTPHSPFEINLSERYTAPNGEHIFGQDEQGRDVFSQVIFGARTSLMISFLVVGISALVGLLLGSFAGYMGGKKDQFIMTVVDIFYAFPGFLLALAIMSVLEPSSFNIILALCLTSWSGFARLVRAEVLVLKEKEFIQSTRALGFSSYRILCKHIWPNLLGLLIVQMSLAEAGVIISEASLSFLGLGVPPTTPTWGALLNSGRKALVEAPHVSLFAGLFIVLLVTSFNLLGEGLRDVLDKKR